MFVFTYLMANHFPWSYRYRDEQSLDWRDLGNSVVDGHRIDEYLRRQEMSAHDYKAFIARLKRDFPAEPFLVIRFGDHQPLFAKKIVEPGLDDVAIGRRIDAADPKFFTTYYSIDPVNFRPADLLSAVSGLDAAYLPLAIWRRRACRLMLRSPSRSAFSSAATGCSISAPKVPKRGASTAY